MWQNALDFLPEKIVFFCTALAFVIPFLIYIINRKLHNFGDPAWKKEEKGVDEK